MPRVLIPVIEVRANSSAIVTTTAVDATNDMYFVNTGVEFLNIRNGGIGASTVIVASVPCSHGRSGDITVVIAAGAEVVLGPFTPELFNQVGTNQTNVNFDVDTSVTIVSIKKKY